MFDYLRAFVRPDGFASLIGDTDGGRVLPIVSRTADDRSYLLALGSVIYPDSHLKLQQPPPEELLWTLGEKAAREYEGLPIDDNIPSRAFTSAGTYFLRTEDLFLLLNANGAGPAGRGSHGHNDVLSIEVSACGRAFIVDPGAYLYTSDLRARHLFRSTGYHSTIQVDDEEQNITDERLPFVIGSEARPQVLSWESSRERDCVVAEHKGYKRLVEPVRHRRKVTFEKADRWWLVEDEFMGKGEHTIAARFHFDAGLVVEVFGGSMSVAVDRESGARLFVCSIDFRQPPTLEPQFTSKHYGSKLPSISACWSLKTAVPCVWSWAIVPVCAGENPVERLRMIDEVGKAILK
jgi:hypothetical protein